MTIEKPENGISLDTSRLRTLVKLMRAMTRARDIHTLIRLLTRETSRALRAERSTVFLFDWKTSELHSFVAEGESRQIRFNADSGIAGHVFKTGEPLIIEDAQNDDRFNRSVDLKTGFVTRNLLTVPISNPTGKTIGVFQVMNSESGCFTPDDIEFLEAIANEAAVMVENVSLSESRKRMFDSMIRALVETIESRDPYTAGHSFRVMEYSREIASRMNIDADTCHAIHYAALLHDYGKIGVPDNILKKKGRLTPEEFSVIRTHVDHTRRILDRIDFEENLHIVPTFAAQHHERLSGTGYPDGLKNGEISIGGMIIAVADVFEALTSRRHYRDPMPDAMAMNILISAIGSEFDSEVVSALRQYLVDSGRITIDQVPIEEVRPDETLH